MKKIEDWETTEYSEHMYERTYRLLGDPNCPACGALYVHMQTLLMFLGHARGSGEETIVRGLLTGAKQGVVGVTVMMLGLAMFGVRNPIWYVLVAIGDRAVMLAYSIYMARRAKAALLEIEMAARAVFLLDAKDPLPSMKDLHALTEKRLMSLMAHSCEVRPVE